MQEAADRGVPLESNRNRIGAAGFGIRACPGEQLGTCGPERLIVDEAFIGCKFLLSLQGLWKRMDLRDCQCAIYGDDRRAGKPQKSVVELYNFRPIGVTRAAAVDVG